MTDAVIELKDVRKTFRDFWLRPTVAAVDGLSLEVRRGEVFGLLGPNGSGKSTTIKMILGLLDPSGGEVRLFGKSPRSVEARSRLGYLPELSYLHPFLTAKETLMYYAGLCGLPLKVAVVRTKQLLAMVGLTDAARRRREKPEDHLDRRRLARAVRPEKPEHLAATHLERESVHRRDRRPEPEVAEGLPHVLQIDYRIRHEISRPLMKWIPRKRKRRTAGSVASTAQPT